MEVTATDLEIRPNDQKIALNFVVGGFAQFAGQVDYISPCDDFLGYLVQGESSRHLHLRRMGALLRDAADFCDFEANFGIGPGVEPIFAEKVHPHYRIGDYERPSGYDDFPLGGAQIVWVDDDRPRDSLRGSIDRFERSIQAKSDVADAAWIFEVEAEVLRSGLQKNGYDNENDCGWDSHRRLPPSEFGITSVREDGCGSEKPCDQEVDAGEKPLLVIGKRGCSNGVGPFDRNACLRPAHVGSERYPASDNRHRAECDERSQ